jgi:hypothetical protein
VSATQRSVHHFGSVTGSVCAKLQTWQSQLTKRSIPSAYLSAAVVNMKVCDRSVAPAFTGVYEHGLLERLLLLMFSESQNDGHTLLQKAVLEIFTSVSRSYY